MQRLAHLRQHWRAVLAAILAALGGAAAGVAIGDDRPAPPAKTVVETSTTTETETETETETVARRVTETETETQTITEGAPPESGSVDDEDGDGCSDSYEGACLDPSDGYNDVNCTDITDRDFDSVGDDPYGLDRDADGTACESY